MEDGLIATERVHEKKCCKTIQVVFNFAKNVLFCTLEFAAMPSMGTNVPFFWRMIFCADDVPPALFLLLVLCVISLRGVSLTRPVLLSVSPSFGCDGVPLQSACKAIPKRQAPTRTIPALHTRRPSFR